MVGHEHKIMMSIKQDTLPEVVEVVRVGPSEEAIEPQRMRSSTLLTRGEEEVTEPTKHIVQRDTQRHINNGKHLLGKVRLRWTLALEVFRVQPRRVEQSIW